MGAKTFGGGYGPRLSPRWLRVRYTNMIGITLPLSTSVTA